MKILDTYREGADILGVNAGDFLPWLGIVGKVAGGAAGGGGGMFGMPTSQQPAQQPAQQQPQTAQQKQVDVAAQVKQALEDERRRQRQEKTEADLRALKTVGIVVGIGGVGLVTWALLRR